MMQGLRMRSLAPACRECLTQTPANWFDLLSEPCREELSRPHAPMNVTKGFD